MAQAGRYREPWEILVRDNPLPAVHGRACYHPCESHRNRAELDSAVSIHAIERFLRDRANEQGWTYPVTRAARGVNAIRGLLAKRHGRQPEGTGRVSGRTSPISAHGACPALSKTIR